MIQWLYRFADSLRDRVRRRTEPPQSSRGRRGEDLAHRFLRAHGFTIVARNYKPPAGGGDIDIVAWQGETLVFVEVKTRSSEQYGTPDHAVDDEKERHLERVARDYARRAGVPWERTRFDIVNVVLGRPPDVQLFPDAFHLKGGL